MTLGDALPRIGSAVPDAQGQAWVERLAASECPALTTRRRRREEQTGAPHDPIVWVEAVGCNVRDADDNVYVDLTSGFGVAFVGHRRPEVVGAVKRQSGRLLHALGDLHPSDVKIELLERLCTLAPWPKSRAMLSLGGGDAITAALKTAVLATGKPGVVAFEGGYHGLAYGPLAVSGYSKRFRAPFIEQLRADVQFVPWPEHEADVESTIGAWNLDWSEVGAVVVEPIQGRAGIRVPPPGFVAALGEAARRNGALLIVDEIYTGLGRSGDWWCSVAAGATPDLICAGKALGGGLPISACIGRESVMQAWGNPDREAIHTGTFYGDPLGAAAALATLDIIEKERLMEVAAERGARLASLLSRKALPCVTEIRQVGLMLGIQLDRRALGLKITRAMLEQGYLVLPAGSEADVVQLSPPATISDAQLEGFVDALERSLETA